MRSYETGKYATLKDGNFQLSMARVLASDFKEITVCIPKDSSDLDELFAKYKVLTDSLKVVFKLIEYGDNAVHTREIFWGVNWVDFWDAEHVFDLLISDITGYKGLLPVIYNFNITKLPELDRPYIDKFWEQDLVSIEQSLFTTVLNPRQRDYIIYVRPDLASKVIVNTKCAHTRLMPNDRPNPAGDRVIFWPFRLTDKAYQWEQFKEEFERSYLAAEGYTVMITDPNESAPKDLRDLPSYVIPMRPTKEEYYEILSMKPIVIMLDDIDKVLHPGTIEFFYYGCNVITFESELIRNNNVIHDLKELSTALAYIDAGYNSDLSNISEFVYSLGEIDKYYNESFVNDRKN